MTCVPPGITVHAVVDKLIVLKPETVDERFPVNPVTPFSAEFEFKVVIAVPRVITVLADAELAVTN